MVHLRAERVPRARLYRPHGPHPDRRIVRTDRARRAVDAASCQDPCQGVNFFSRPPCQVVCQVLTRRQPCPAGPWTDEPIVSARAYESRGERPPRLQALPLRSSRSINIVEFIGETGAAQEGRGQLQGPLPVPRGEVAHVRGHARARDLEVLRLWAGRRHLQLRDAARRGRLPEALRRLAGRAGVELASGRPARTPSASACARRSRRRSPSTTAS